MTPHDEPTLTRSWLPRGFFHPVSLAGMALTLIGLFGVVGILVAAAVVERAPAYLGLAVLPMLLLLAAGMVLVPIGVRRDARAVARGETVRRSLLIDFDRPAHRHAAAVIVGVGLMALVIGVSGTVQTFQAMESQAFCGQVCHSVMSPEATTARHSPHANVKCVECHVGEGAGGFLHAKLGGLRRVAALLTGSVDRPIPTPVQGMRPARARCEKCHASDRFISYKEKRFHYYASDEESTPNTMRMLMKVGGGGSAFVKGAGIHYHMLSSNKVEFVAADHRDQEIAWVRVTREDGSVEEFEHEHFTLSADERGALPVREMDCLDCHNRPAHQFSPPEDAVNRALAAGRLDARLPYIKVEAVRALDGAYETTEAAMAGIEESLRGFYQSEYPELVEEKSGQLSQAVETLRELFRTTMFPAMNATWSAYPDNISHRDWPGCFRCHAAEMISLADGESMFANCNTCHLILAQGQSEDEAETASLVEGRTFYHPGYDEEIAEYSACIECHTGGADLY